MVEAVFEEMLVETGLAFLCDVGLDVTVLTGPPEAHHKSLDSLKEYLQARHDDADDASSQRLAELILEYRAAHPVPAPADAQSQEHIDLGSPPLAASAAPAPKLELPSNLLELLEMARLAAAPVEGRDVLAFIGETGAGKTTCIRHFLNDNLDLMVQHMPLGRKTVIDSPDGPRKEFAIGHGASCTRTVATIDEPRTGLLIVDLPGDNDTESSVPVLLFNALLRAFVLRNSKTVRLVYLDSIDNFTGARGKSYVQRGFAPLAEVFCEVGDAKNSALLLFSPIARTGTGGDLQRLVNDPPHVLLEGVLMELAKVRELVVADRDARRALPASAELIFHAYEQLLKARKLKPFQLVDNHVRCHISNPVSPNPVDLVNLAADLKPVRDTQAVFRRSLPSSVIGMLREKLDRDVDIVKDCCQRDNPEATRLESAADAAFNVVSMCASMLNDLEIRDRLFETRLASVETIVKQFWQKTVKDVKNALVRGRPADVQTCVDAFEVTVRSFHDRVRAHVGSAAIAATFELPPRDDAQKVFAQQLMELFDAAKRDDATVPMLLVQANNLAELQRVVFPDARVPLTVTPAASFAGWVCGCVARLEAGISFHDPHTKTSRSAVRVVLEMRQLHAFGVMQPFLDVHRTPLDEKFVKTHIDAAWARVEGELQAEKTALMRELNSVASGVGGPGCGERLSAFRDFVSCRELKEELDRPELYEEFYADFTNVQSIDEPLDEIDDERRLTNLLNVCAVYAKSGDQIMEKKAKVKQQEITAAVNKQARQSRETIVRLVREEVGNISRRVRTERSAAAHAAQMNGNLDPAVGPPVSSQPANDFMCQGVGDIAERVTKLAQITQADEVLKQHDVSSAMYCTSQLDCVMKSLVNAMDSVRREVDQVKDFMPMECGVVPLMHGAVAWNEVWLKLVDEFGDGFESLVPAARSCCFEAHEKHDEMFKAVIAVANALVEALPISCVHDWSTLEASFVSLTSMSIGPIKCANKLQRLKQNVEDHIQWLLGQVKELDERKDFKAMTELILRDAMPLKAAKIRGWLEIGERLVKHLNWRIQDLIDTANSITAQNEPEQFVMVRQQLESIRDSMRSLDAEELQQARNVSAALQKMRGGAVEAQTEFLSCLTLTPSTDSARNLSGAVVGEKLLTQSLLQLRAYPQKREATLQQVEKRVRQLLERKVAPADEVESLRAVAVFMKDPTMQAELKTGYERYEARQQQENEKVIALQTAVENLLKDVQTVSPHLLREKVQKLDVAMKCRQALSEVQHEGIDEFMSDALSKCVAAVGTCSPKAMIATLAALDRAALTRDFQLTWSTLALQQSISRVVTETLSKLHEAASAPKLDFVEAWQHSDTIQTEILLEITSCHLAGAFPSLSAWEDTIRNLNLLEKEKSAAKQRTNDDVSVLLELAQDPPPQTVGLPSFSRFGKDILRQHFRAHAEHSSRKKAASELPAEFARRIMDCQSLEAETRASTDAWIAPIKEKLGAFVVTHEQSCRAAQEELLQAAADALASGAVRSDVVQMVRRLQECQEAGSLLGNHADMFVKALKAYWASLIKLHQKCLKQIEARNIHGDFETHARWLCAVASLSEAEREFFVGTRESHVPFSLQTLCHQIGASIGKVVGNSAEELPQLITDEKFEAFASLVGFVRLLHEQYHDAPGVQTSTLSDCHVMQHCRPCIEAAHRHATAVTIGSQELAGFNSAVRVLSALAEALEHQRMCKALYLKLRETINELSQPILEIAQGALARCTESLQQVKGVDDVYRQQECGVFLAKELVGVKNVALQAPTVSVAMLDMNRRILEAAQIHGDKNCIKRVHRNLLRTNVHHVLNDFPDLFGNVGNSLFAERSGELTLDYLMDKMKCCCEPPMTDNEMVNLERLLEQYAIEKKAWMDEYLLLPSLESVRRRARLEVYNALQAIRADDSSENSMNLITRLSLAYTFATTRATDVIEDTSLGRQFITPHLVQIMTICRCLALESSASKGNLITRILNFFRNFTHMNGAKETEEKHLRNHLVQILTGEGKSITLAIIAAYCALRGIDVDIACYSEYLTRRDEQDMKPFFDLLDIQPGQVRYQTFEQLCARAFAGVGAVAKQVITTGQAPADTSGVLDEGRARVLLVDEVDVFFQREFFGETYNMGIHLRSAEISALVHLIFQQRNNLGFDVQPSPEAEAVRQKHPQHPKMIPLLNSLFNELVEKSRKFAERKSEFDVKEKTVKYKFRESFTSKIVFPNETMFQYLHLADAGEVDPADAEKHVGIDVNMARFSYAEIPKRNYYAVLGVTGTLRTIKKLDGTPDEYILDEDERKFLDRDFGIRTFTYVPSVFGVSKLEFAFRTDVAVLHDEPQWHNRLQEVADDVSKSQNAVIIFFDTFERLVKAKNHLPLLTSAQLLHESTPASQVGPIVTAATQPGAILLSTATFGRGTNFFCADTTVVVTVVQAFYSASLSEEVQIKGRTARQKQEGRFRVVLCSEHLAADYFLDEPDTETGVTPTRLDNVRSHLQRAIDANTLEDLMKRQRALKMKALNEGRRERIAAARQLHRKAEAMVSTAVKETDAQKQLTTFLEACQMEVVTSRLVVLVLDESKSMEGAPWANLVAAYKDFMKTLRRAGDGTHIVVVGFACRAGIHADGSLKSFNFDLPAARIADNGGTTNFEAAFSAVDNVINRDEFRAHSVSIVFLTDGCPSNGDSHTPVVRSMLDLRAVREFFCIYFNRHETVPIAVKNLHETVEQKQVRAVMSHARTTAELSTEMKAAASGAPMHRH